MMYPRPFSAVLRRFARSEEGSISVEAMLIFPILLWCYLATFVFFDAFRSQSTNLKAAYTIGDTLSRETGYVTPAYLDSLSSLQKFLVDEDNGIARLRVTVYRYQASDNTYRVRWSRTRGGGLQMTDAVLASMRTRLPVMPDTEIAILVETWVGYHPSYSVGLHDFTFDDFVVTRPRFAGQLCVNSSNAGGTATATC
jgi:Flp pilus assembly protein TadG